jgi:putative lipoprotein
VPIVSVIAVALTLSSGAAPPDPDPWFGRDKLQHFGVSAALAVGGYGASAMVFRDERARLATGAGLALTLGAARELDNLGGTGQPSWRDMAWNAIGIAVGLSAAWLVDSYVMPRLPAWAKMPTATRPNRVPQAPPAMLRIVF